ncbi:multidrug resistance protein homolog 49-like [Schistocerca cancellata]|uniref:multidrug resistance protein homolog 49-like n=1 Tax=Schistocerca cancellata TaxID=274614 RepID=UPI0021197A4A|nr:multidrug resistance protein homolog 49-like [Schistocerca cancellata]
MESAKCGSSINVSTGVKDGKNPTKLNFLPRLRTTDPNQLESVAYYQLFQYATCWEQLLMFLGVTLGVITGLCMPAVIVLYGEFTTILVDRNAENITSSPTTILPLAGGGRILVNASWEERKEALLEDSAAFAIGCCVVTLIQFIVGSMTIFVLNHSAQRQVTRIRRLFMKAVLRQEMAWYDTNNTSTFASRLAEDLDKLQDGIGEKLGMFIYLLVSFISSVIMSFFHGWKLTLVVLSSAPIIIFSTAVVAKVQSSLTAQELDSYGTAGATVEEVLSSIRTVMAFGGQEKEVERYKERLHAAETTGIRRGFFSGLGGGVMWFIIYSSYALAFWYGVELIINSREMGDTEYTPAVIVIVLFGVLAGAINMGMASPHLEAFAMAKGSAAAIFKVLNRRPEIDSLSEEGNCPEKCNGEIELKNIHFLYPSRPDVKVLQGLELKIRPGETVALVGSSGCGKSTVVQLIQRLYDPQLGSVSLDGCDLRNLNVRWLRSNIGVVGQEPVLFATTIAENIRYGKPDASQAEIEKAAIEANAHDFICRMPQGYDTLVGDRGAQLSGGQKQRIAIARALVRNPRILLLDEATSALDTHSEAHVQAALEKASAGRTTVLVAHRLSTVVSADRIIVLSGGCVVEEGTHSELIALNGYYSKLVAAAGRDEPTQQQSEAVTGEKADGPIFEFSRKFSSPKDHLQTATSVEEEKIPEADLGRIMSLNQPEWLYITVGCLATLAVGSALPFFAVLFGEIYRVLSIQDADEVRRDTSTFSILFLVIGILSGVGTFLQMHMFGVAGVRLTKRLRVMVFDSILRQEAAWFDDERNAVGVLCARLSGDASSVQGATGSRISTILQSTSTLVIGFALAVYYSWKLALVAILAVPIVFIGVYLESRHMRGQGLHEKEALEGASKIAVEAISSIRTVVSLGSEITFLEKYTAALAECHKTTRIKTRVRGLVFALGQCGPFFTYAFTLYYGGYLVAHEGLQYENVIKVSEAMIFGAWMLGQSLAFAPNFSTAKMAAARLFALMDRKPTIDVTFGDKMLQLNGEVRYDKVDFRYPTRPGVQVLKSLNLLVPAGKTVALVGPSGCGKSTCLQLLQRLYDPLAGTVNVDGTNVSFFPLGNLRSQMGIVSQEPVLFDRTIAENIAYGDNSRAVSMDEIMAAAKAANIHTFVASLPLGYETRLGQKGTQLSGGQKQRIAIARALVRNPKVLLLDEATSALDNESEKVVQEALDQAREGRTCITIAHRLSSIQQADVIYVISNGAVLEKGSHQQLMTLRGMYYQMHQQGL